VVALIVAPVAMAVAKGGEAIGLFTALMVQQVGPQMPDAYAWIVWVAPTAIGSPLLARWIAAYRRQFAGAPAPTSAMPTPATQLVD
jgi:hypothetical protein